MKKLIALVLALVCVVGMVGCSTKDEVIEKQSEFEATVLEVTDHYLLVEPIEGSIELNSSDEIKVGIQDKTSWPIPQVGEMVRVVYDGLVQETDPARITNPYRVEIIISDENDTIQFHDKVFSKSDLSQETIEWLEKYNELSEDEQLAISSIPSDLYELCGYGNATEEVAPTEVESIDYPPMVMFNDILYTATSYSGDKEDLSVVGKIESCIDYGVPTENNQANDTLVGCEIYTTSSARDFIFVLNNGAYSPYKSTDGAGIE